MSFSAMVGVRWIWAAERLLGRSCWAGWQCHGVALLSGLPLCCYLALFSPLVMLTASSVVLGMGSCWLPPGELWGVCGLLHQRMPH